jgi:hypothetical protein
MKKNDKFLLLGAAAVGLYLWSQSRTTYAVLTPAQRAAQQSAATTAQWTGIIGAVESGIQSLFNLFGGSPATTPGMPSSTVWIAAPELNGDGSLFVGVAPPGSSPPWREASQAEIAAAGI